MNGSRKQQEHAIDVKVVFSEHLRAVIDRIPRTVEDATQHVLRNRKFHAASCELDMCRLDVYARSPLKHLDNSLLPLHFKDLATPFGSVWQRELHNFIVRSELGIDLTVISHSGNEDKDMPYLYVVQHYQRANWRVSKGISAQQTR